MGSCKLACGGTMRNAWLRKLKKPPVFTVRGIWQSAQVTLPAGQGACGFLEDSPERLEKLARWQLPHLLSYSSCACLSSP